MNEREYRKAAEVAHELFCKMNHIDRCDWEYGGWSTEKGAHPRWLERVVRIAGRRKLNPAEMIEYLQDLKERWTLVSQEVAVVRGEKYGP